MKNTPLMMVAAVALLLSACTTQTNEKTMEYPKTAKVDTVDHYFGTSIPDPYRWLEDDNSEATKAWVKEENAVTDAFMAQIPFRQQINDRLTSIWNYPKVGLPFKEGNYWYVYKNTGLQAQSVLYRMSSLEADESEVFLDPNTFSEDGTVALSGLSFSKDGSLCAYSISKGGSDWKEIFVIDTKTKKRLDDHLQWIKFSGMSWYKDGFYYSRYDAPKEGDELKGVNTNNKVYYHKAGTAQSEDQLMFEDPKNPTYGWYMSVTEDERFLILSGNKPSANGNSLHFKRTTDKTSAKFIALQESYEYSTYVLDNEGDKLFLVSDKNAPRKMIYTVDAKQPQKATTLIPQQEDVLSDIKIADGKLLLTYMHDAYSKSYLYSLEGKQIAEIPLPGIGSIGGFSGKKEDSELFFSFTSFTTPNTAYKFNATTNKVELYRKSAIDFDVDKYETKQIFYTSKDGTKVPMFIVHKKGLKLDGNNPTLLYGYGGFNISLTPFFSISNLILLENGGVFALPNLRGGGEYGEDWHQGGTQLNKQNVFDDFISAAEYLINNKYTCADKLAIKGGSNGGLLVGACMTQRPDLYKVAIPQVGVLDMLRYHKFTIGYYWAPDYGTSKDSLHFANLLKYSPLHNVKDGVCYPATLITTADHDDRVVPAHSFKFAAELQSKQACNTPTLIRIESKAGHGAGKSTQQIIDEASDIWAFMFYNMGLNIKY